MEGKPHLTVAIPTCNGARHLPKTLASLKTQADQSFDLIISDDRSDDETLLLVRQELGDRARIQINSERLGLAGNWNRCVELSQTEWVALFHQDDVMHPGHLARHAHVIANQFPAAPLGIVAGAVVMIDDSSQPIPASIVDPGGLEVALPVSAGFAPTTFVFSAGHWLSLLATSNPLRCSAVTLRKAAHQSVGGFDPSYRYVVDWDFWVRLSRDWGLAWCPGPPTVSMRWHRASETQRFRTGTADLEETTRLLDSIATMENDSPDQRKRRKLADARLSRAYLNRAHDALKARDTALSRRCLARSLRLSPAILATIARDPRLAVQMGSLLVSPALAAQLFGNKKSGE